MRVSDTPVRFLLPQFFLVVRKVAVEWTSPVALSLSPVAQDIPVLFQMISDLNNLEKFALCFPHHVAHGAKYGVDPAAGNELIPLAVRGGAHCACEVVVELERQESATIVCWNCVAGAVAVIPVLAQTALQ